MADIADTYRIIEPDKSFEDDFSWYFEIIEGEYIGTVFKFERVTFGEPTKDDRLPFSFEFHIAKDPCSINGNKEARAKFALFISKIFMDFFAKNADSLISGSERKSKAGVE